MGCGASSAAGGVAPAPQAQEAAPVQQQQVVAPAPAPAVAAEAPAAKAEEAAAPAPVAAEAPAPAPAAEAAPAPADEVAAPAVIASADEANVQGALPNKKAMKPLSWAEIRARLPYDQSPDQKEAREKLFKQFDVNGSGQLSLAEVDKAMRDVLAIGEIFNAKPVIIRAFEQVKGLDGQKGVAANGLNNADFVSFAEFRQMLQYLYFFFVLYEFFNDIDTDDEGRVSLKEFKAAQAQLEWMGIKIADPEAEFATIVKTPGANNMLFSEFSEWALAKNLQHMVHE